MTDHFLLNVDAELAYTFDFSHEITAPVSLVSVTFSTEPVSGGVTLFGQSDNLAAYKSTIGIKGAQHGRAYTVQALGVTSGGEKIVKDITVQGFNA